MNNAPNITPAPLSNPTYYLENALAVWQWVEQHHKDLLKDSQRAHLFTIKTLSSSAQALLVRLVMRRGVLFNSDSLAYSEIENPHDALVELQQQALIDPDPMVTFAEAAQKLTKTELLEFAQRSHMAQSKAIKKLDLVAALAVQLPHDTAHRMSHWTAHKGWIRLLHREDYQLYQLLFFGNLHQSWSEFVVTELGHIQYETVQLTPSSRAFGQQQDIEHYLRLEAISEYTHTPCDSEIDFEIDTDLLKRPFANRWLESKRKRACYAYAQFLEKAQQLQQSIRYYQYAGSHAANVRMLRLMERVDTPQAIVALAEPLFKECTHPETKTLIARILKRQKKKQGLSFSTPKPFTPTVKNCLLPVSELSVEQSVANALATPTQPVYYVENRLIPALWALLYWDAVYLAVPGAFFHPFQSAPRDLYSEDFWPPRQAALNKVDAWLSSGQYKTVILKRFDQKYGVSHPFIHWPTLTATLLTQALDCIPKTALQGMFRYFMSDMRHHKRGMPDLVQFHLATQQVEFIEVKAPNDTLQDHQRLWLHALDQLNISVHVANVRWQSESDVS